MTESMNIFEINLEAIRDINVLVLAFVAEQSRVSSLFSTLRVTPVGCKGMQSMLLLSYS